MFCLAYFCQKWCERLFFWCLYLIPLTNCSMYILCPLAFVVSCQWLIHALTVKHNLSKRLVKKLSKPYPFTLCLIFAMEIVVIFIVLVHFDPNLYFWTLRTMFILSVGEGFLDCLMRNYLYCHCLDFFSKMVKSLVWIRAFKIIYNASISIWMEFELNWLKEFCSMLVCF